MTQEASRSANPGCSLQCHQARLRQQETWHFRGTADTPNRVCQHRMHVRVCTRAHTHIAHYWLPRFPIITTILRFQSNSTARHGEASPEWQGKQTRKQCHSAALGRKAYFPSGDRGQQHGFAAGDILSSLQKTFIGMLKLSKVAGRVPRWGEGGSMQCSGSRALMGCRLPWTLAGPLAFSPPVTRLPFSLRGV